MTLCWNVRVLVHFATMWCCNRRICTVKGSMYDMKVSITHAALATSRAIIRETWPDQEDTVPWQRALLLNQLNPDGPTLKGR